MYLFNLSQAGLCSDVSCSPLCVASTTLPIQPLEKNPEKLSLALEPDSAAIFCQTIPRTHLAPQCQATKPFTASRYLIVDIGGGTVDILAHDISGGADKHIRVIYPPTGNDSGGTQVNKGFCSFLENLVEDTGFTKFLDTSDKYANAKNQSLFNKLINETFEQEKVHFGDQRQLAKDEMLSVALPNEFLEIYHSNLEKNLRTMGGSVAKLVSHNLQLSYDLMEKLFEPVRDEIIDCIKKTLEDVEENIETIYFVGGFGGCEYLLREMKKTFERKNYQFIIPCDPAFAVVKGAVLCRLQPHMIKLRKADATYGLEVRHSFITELHDPEYHFVNDDGEPRCNSLFSTIVERGDLVGGDEVFTQAFSPLSHDQKSMSIQFYCGMERDMWYVTGRRGKGSRFTEPASVQKIGTIEIEMPILRGDKNRIVDVTFDFSHAEIQVQAFDRTSKNKVHTVLDYLTLS